MKTYKYIALAALALGFAACTQDDDFAPQQEDIVKIASANIATEVQTRVNTLADGTQWENNDQILLVNNSRDNKNSGTYTYNDNAWSLTDGLVLYASGTNDFTAYYPASVDFTLPTDQSTEAGIKSADRMTASDNGVAKGATVALSFERKNAMVTITPSFNTEFGDDATISSLQIAGITPYHPTDAKDYKAIIAPSETGFTVSVSVSGVEQPLTATTSTVIESGKYYTFNLTVGKEAVKIGVVNVTPWTEQDIPNVDTEELPSNAYDATAMTAKQLNVAVAKALAYGHTNISITLAADAGEDMFKAITSALSADGIAEGSIDLTISGALTVPKEAFYGDEYGNENYRASEVLKSVTLTDATTIGELAFSNCNMSSFSAPDVISIGENALSPCKNLTEVYLPSVKTLGTYVFGECSALKTISIPECVTIENAAFVWCKALETVYAPKATNLGPLVFKLCTSLTKVTLGSVESVNQQYESYGLFNEANDTKNIDLVLSSEQKVMTFDNSTKYWTAGTEDFDFGNATYFIGYTFKSITSFAE